MRFPPFAPSALICLALAQSAAAGDAYTGKAYNDSPQGVPGKIEAEYYDTAPGNANDIAYHRHGQPRKGPERTTGDCIGLGRIDGSHVSVTGQKETGGVYVGWTDVGDWWNYTVLVAADGTYTFGAKLAAGARGAKISVTFRRLQSPGELVTTGPLTIPTTAGFQPGVEVYHVWETLDNLAQVKLTKGLYVMTVKVDAVAGLNLDYYTLALAR